MGVTAVGDIALWAGVMLRRLASHRRADRTAVGPRGRPVRNDGLHVRRSLVLAAAPRTLALVFVRAADLTRERGARLGGPFPLLSASCHGCYCIEALSFRLSDLAKA